MNTRVPERQQPAIIALSVLVYRWLLSLGPAAFARDYAEPALLDFRQCCRAAYRERGSFGVLCLWPRLLGETMMGILAEYVSETFGRRGGRPPTIQRSIVAAFCAWVLFLFAYIALGRIVDPVAPFNAVGRLNPEVGISYAVVVRGGVVTLLAIVLGGLPVLFQAVRRAMARGVRGVLGLFVLRLRQAFFLLGVALVIAVCGLGYLLATASLSGAPRTCAPASQCLWPQPPLLLILDLAALVGVVTLLVFIALALTASLSLAVLRSELSLRLLRFVLVPIAVVVLGMGLVTLGETLWLVRLWMVAPRFAASSSGLGYGQTMWVVATIAAMACATFVAATAFRNGLRANRQATV